MIHPNDFKTKPMQHQMDSIVWARMKDRITLWHDVGLGKSLTSLYTHQTWETQRLLVVCPNSVVETWLDQVGQHTDWVCCSLRGTAMERRRLLKESKVKVFVLNYEGLQVLFGRRIKQGRRTTWVMDRHAIREADFDGCIFDECQALMNYKAIRTRVCRELSKLADHAIMQTATPISTSEANLWSEYDVLDGGYTLGASRMNFLRKYFDQDWWGKWTIKGEQALEDILDRIAPVTSRYSSEECLDLPDKIYEQRHCDMTKVQRQETKRIIDDDIDPMLIGNKLAQIAGGILIEDGKPRRLEGKNPKLEELEILLKELPGKILVFHSYVEEGRMMEDRLKKLGIGFASMRGETDKNEYKRFKTDDDCRVLVAHPKSGGVGINLQEASTVIFFSNGVGGAIVREQAEGRIWRMGQKHSCLYIDLVLRESIDGERLERLQDRAEMAQRVLNYMEDFGG